MCGTDAKDLGNLERSMWPQGLRAGFAEEVGGKVLELSTV